ncbi:MAG TPA: hypothetical protein VFY93_18180 [Planctomycetota bacterium]|nr:hypothetical protein [Planctomycetota bacterium]
MAALAALLLAGGALADSNEQLFEILKLHEKLATEDAFQQQAKLLGAYLEAAQSMREEQRVLVYERVLGILRRIEEDVAAPAPARAPAPPGREPVGHTALGSLDPGSARLEWFKAESLDLVPDVPVRKGLWTRDLVAMGEEDDPDLPRTPEAPIARITFYLEVKTPGEHAFTAQHGGNDLRIIVGGKPVIDVARGGAHTARGVAHLERGFHRVDVLLRYDASGDPSFAVKVLRPGAGESHILARSDLLLTRPAASP